MARYCIAFETMELFHNMKPSATVEYIVRFCSTILPKTDSNHAMI